MRDLASFVMQGPRQAATVATISTLVPMMFWVGAAVICLVTLRRGLSAGLQIFVWAAIPAFAWWYGTQDPGALIVLVSSMLMAATLRATTSWQAGFAAGALSAVVVGVVVPWIAPETIELLLSLAEQVFLQAAEDAQIEYTTEIQDSFRSLMIASFAATFYGISIGALCLARYWQSALYNPGGWRQEFHDMRLEPKWLLGAAVASFLVPALGVSGSLVFLTILFPVMICGIALIHGVVARKSLNVQWLFIFYLMLIVTFPTLLVMVVMFAIVDSAIDFRGRMDLLSRDSQDS